MIPAVLLLPSAISTRLHFHFLSPVIPSSRCLWRPPSFPTAPGQLRPFPSPSPPPSLSPHPHYPFLPFTSARALLRRQFGFGATLRGERSGAAPMSVGPAMSGTDGPKQLAKMARRRSAFKGFEARTATLGAAHCAWNCLSLGGMRCGRGHERARVRATSRTYARQCAPRLSARGVHQ